MELPDPNFWSTQQRAALSDAVRIPELPMLDGTLTLLKHGYGFISGQCRHYHSDAFTTRLLGARVVCLSSREAAQLFYSDNFERRAAAPKFVLKTLFGKGGVQTLDGRAHHHRKALFMSFMTRARVESLLSSMAREWDTAMPAWRLRSSVVLLDAIRDMLCGAACRWCGLKPAQEEIAQLSADCGKMVNGFATLGPRHWKALRARTRAERWAEGVVLAARRGKLEVEVGSPADSICRHTDLDGQLLPSRVAAVELLNLIRPICAITVYINFAMLALRDHPKCQSALRSGSLRTAHFVQEVRRFYPFTPFVAARARHPFHWRGIEFEEEQLVLLDVYGLNRDARYWDSPESFRPRRFEATNHTNVFIPQGGGDFLEGHRCAGEAITLQLMQQAVERMLEIEYEVPAQDLSYRLSRLPTWPESGFVISRVRGAAFGV